MDAFLSMAHWWSVLALVVVLGAEFAACRGSLNPEAVMRLSRLDIAYGALSGVVVVVGVLRVLYGAKGWAFYVGNPAFWVKIALFAGIGIVSIKPTLAILGWRRQARQGAVIDIAQVAPIRRWIHIELALLMLIPIAAALMARGIGF